MPQAHEHHEPSMHARCGNRMIFSVRGERIKGRNGRVWSWTFPGFGFTDSSRAPDLTTCLGANQVCRDGTAWVHSTVKPGRGPERRGQAGLLPLLALRHLPALRAPAALSLHKATASASYLCSFAAPGMTECWGMLQAQLQPPIM